MNDDNIPIAEKFRVVRQDTHGNQFSVEDDLNAEQADEMVEEYSKRPHHQGYWKQPMSVPLKNPSL